MTVPGVGCISALSFYTAIDEPSRFIRNEDVGPYLGLAPKLNQSGQSSRMGHISKRGNQMTRSHLVSAAKVLMQLSKQDNTLRRWALALKERAGPSKARVALARRLAVVLLAIWKSGQRFDPQRIPTCPLAIGAEAHSTAPASVTVADKC
jgi:transposase